MINALNELEKVCKKHVPNTGMVHDLQEDGIKCLIDHGVGTKDLEFRQAKMWGFVVTINVRDQKENWRTVLKALLGIARDLTDQKEYKWNVGDIEREDSVSEYSLTISLTIFYHPGD